MRRIGLAVVLMLGLVIAPLAVEAEQTRQATKVPRVGIIGSNTLTVGRPALLEGFREHGWVDGQNITIEWREAEGKPERIPALVRELVELPVDVLVVNRFAIVVEATRASHVIPIVVAGGVPYGDLIRAGLAQSIPRPGGAVTGVLAIAVGGEGLNAKYLQLLKEVAPRVSRVAHLFSPPYIFPIYSAETTAGLKLKVLPVEVASPEKFEEAFKAIRAARVDAIRVNGSPFFVTHRQRIIEFAARERLPASGWWRGFSDSGGLMSYGVDGVEVYRKSIPYVDKILKGAKPGDLPFEQPRKYELVINLKTAKALGLTIPQPLLLRADEVIQ
jgi:putative ABC transport system substrate-binding protein